MIFKPIPLMLDRVDRFGSESDSALFTELLYAGEFVTKIATAIFLSGIEEDRENHRYRLIHGLVRADGLGDWSRALDDALTGAASQHMVPPLYDARRVLTERVGKGNWQFETLSGLHRVLMGIDSETAALGDRAALRTWFQMFVQLRNRSRGHGALTPAKCSELVEYLNSSVRLLCIRNPIFSLPFAYLHRNLSGKYRVVSLGGDESPFEELKSTKAIRGEHLVDGIYVWAGRFRRVELLYTDLDTSDFFVPNGDFRNNSFEYHSLLTDNRMRGDATPYLTAAGERPPSETVGKSELDVVGNAFTNLPNPTPGYVPRPSLEGEVHAALINDRHPIVTLVGRGGIGKTSTALHVLREVALSERFQVIIWFSARDIDLTMTGAKPVQPHLLTERDIASEYQALIGASYDGSGKKASSTSLMEERLRKSPEGATLFVFDNFETVRSPVDLFQWIDMNIRLPNKALITTRFREFKADYPIDVPGMERGEAESLIRQTSNSLGISSLIGTGQIETIFNQSDGHPYVIKILLGEIADAGKFSTPEKVIARKEDILDALFERTYANLSPIASRIFLTLSGWRSLVPQLAVEAVLLSHGDTDMDPQFGIDQLVRMSLLERNSADDGSDFVGVPLTASLFGRRKLEVSPIRALIEEDIGFLQDIGATAKSGLKAGIRPRIQSFFKKAARRLSDGTVELGRLRPILEFLARGYPPAWLLLSEFEEEVSRGTDYERAAECVRRFLETHPPEEQAGDAWRRLVELYQLSGDVVGGCGALLKASASVDPPLSQISKMANWLNNSSDVIAKIDVPERRAIFKPLAALLERHAGGASATDLSRLAWLHLHSGDPGRALDVAQLGLQREPENVHCQRLAAKLTESH